MPCGFLDQAGGSLLLFSLVFLFTATAQNPMLAKSAFRYVGGALSLFLARARLSRHWSNASDCYNTDMVAYKDIARGVVLVLSARWEGEELSEEGLRRLSAEITGFGDDNVNIAGANAPNPGALYLSITCLPLHTRGSRNADSNLRAQGADAHSMGTSAYAMGTSAYALGTDKHSMGTSKVKVALKAAPQYRCNRCVGGRRPFGSNAKIPRCPACRSKSTQML